MASIANFRRLAKAVLRRPEWILALAASLVAFGLHCFFLGHAGGLWRDEVNLVNLSGRHSLTEMSRDSFPVLMPLLVGGWTAIGLGQNDLNLRVLGALIGLALPVALWLAVWKIRRTPPLIGLVLLTLNSTVIQFGDSLRAFGLGSVLILLTTAAGGWFLSLPTWRRAGGLAALAILSVQALYQNSVLIAAICFGAWAVCARQKNRRMAVKILVVAMVAAVSLLPYWARIVSMPASASALRVGFHPMYVFTNFDIAAGFPILQYTWLWELFALVVVVFGIVSLRARSKTNPQDASALFCNATTLLIAAVTVAGFFWFAASPATRWCFIPLMAVAIVLCDARSGKRFAVREAGPDANTTAPADADLPLFAGVALLSAFTGFAGFLWYAGLASEPWYFLPLLALTAAAFELGLPLASRHFRAAIFGFAAMTIVLAIPAARDDLSWRFTNVDIVAQRLTKEVGPGDFIIVSPWFCGVSFERYYRGPASWDTLPPLKDHSIHRFDLVREQMQKTDVLRPVFDQISATLRSGHRVWVVGTVSIPKNGEPMPADLPPAPLNYSGSDLRYTENWASQVARFLGDHSRQFTQADFKTNQKVAPENLKMLMAEGWSGAPDNLNSVNAKTNAP